MPDSTCRVGLLEAIQAGASLEYLSDLHEARYRERVCASVDRIAVAEFSIEEWRRAARYILGSGVNDTDAASIRERILAASRDS